MSTLHQSFHEGEDLDLGSAKDGFKWKAGEEDFHGVDDTTCSSDAASLLRSFLPLLEQSQHTFFHVFLPKRRTNVSLRASLKRILLILLAVT